MDVELQILKHLKRDARPTVSVIDQYCCTYNDLFDDVRSYGVHPIYAVRLMLINLI